MVHCHITLPSRAGRIQSACLSSQFQRRRLRSSHLTRSRYRLRNSPPDGSHIYTKRHDRARNSCPARSTVSSCLLAYWVRFKKGQSPTNDSTRRYSALLSAYRRLSGRVSRWLVRLDEAVIYMSAKARSLRILHSDVPSDEALCYFAIFLRSFNVRQRHTLL